MCSHSDHEKYRTQDHPNHVVGTGLVEVIGQLLMDSQEHLSLPPPRVPRKTAEGGKDKPQSAWRCSKEPHLAPRRVQHGASSKAVRHTW